MNGCFREDIVMMSFFSASSPSVERPLHVVEFKTRLLKIGEKLGDSEEDCCKRFNQMLLEPDLFANTSNGWQLEVNWPDRNKMIHMRVVANPQINQLSFFIKDRLFLQAVVLQNQIKIEYCNLRVRVPHISQEGVSSLIDGFNEVIKAPHIEHVGPIKKTDQPEVKHKKGVCFNQKEFSNLISQYKTTEFDYRINQVVVKNAIHKGNKFYIHLNWHDVHGDKKRHHLRVAFERDDFKFSSEYQHDYSWCFTEKVMLTCFPGFSQRNMQTGQYYYRVNIDEQYKEKGKKNKKYFNILNVWMTLDGEYGEIHDVHKGVNLSGNDVLDIYQYFDELFQIKRVFICDESKLESAEVYVPLRVVAAIATGKTWYESKLHGLRLFECRAFQTAANGVITQSKKGRENALYDLQQLKIKDWLEMLPNLGKLRLEKLCQQVKEMNQADDITEMTLQAFTSDILNDARAKHAVTGPLKELRYLLIDLHAQPEWISERINSLIDGGRFWVKYRDGVEPIVLNDEDKIERTDSLAVLSFSMF